MDISFPSRTKQLSALASASFDVLVVGGGITGAGVARDAAMRGLSVALVEQHDFASGTSSRSSRLVHGGVRYLEHGQLGMVFESSRERRTLLRIAPHLVRPLAFTWPVYRGARIPRWKLAAGLALYDALALFRNVRAHERLDARGVTRHEPQVRADRLLGGARYYDAATDDVRLTLANVVGAVEAGAVCLNHVRMNGLRRDGARVSGAGVTDTETGATIEVRARVVVSATGPWSQGVRGSKGAHVSVARSRVGNTDALTLTAPQDGRVMFVLPSGAFTIIGTTDTFDDVLPDDVRATEADVGYLLAAANHYFPDAQLERGDVVSAWAGLRPLAAATSTKADPGGASREHAITEVEPGLLRVTGGKLTTYRAMAGEIVDRAARMLGKRSMPSSTAHRALPGGDMDDVAHVIAAATDVIGDGPVAERLVHAHGTRWRDVWAHVANDSSLRERITPERPYVKAELLHGIRAEMARTLGDLLIRRVPIAFETRDHGRAAARAVVADVARWLELEEASALVAYDSEVARMFTVDPRTDPPP